MIVNMLSFPFFLLFIFSNMLNNSFSVLETGSFPYISRLNNGNYIILSSNKIIFADPTLNTELSSKNIGFLFYDLTKANSMNMAQFKSTDNGYIIALVYNTIFIFSSNGEYCSQLEDSDINPDISCSIIPKNHLDDKYYFVVIFIKTIEENNNALIFNN